MCDFQGAFREVSKRFALFCALNVNAIVAVLSVSLLGLIYTYELRIRIYRNLRNFIFTCFFFVRAGVSVTPAHFTRASEPLKSHHCHVTPERTRYGFSTRGQLILSALTPPAYRAIL